MPDFSYAISVGWDVINPTNIEDIVSEAPHIMPNQFAPLMGPQKTRALSGKARRDGAVSVRWVWDKMLRTDFNTLVTTIWGNFTVASVKVTITTRDASGEYGSFNAYAEQPVVGEDYAIGPGGVYLRDVTLTFFALTTIGSFDLSFDLSFEV